MNDHLEEFAMMYIKMVRDSVIKVFGPDVINGSVTFSRSHWDEAFASMTFDQRSAVRELLCMVTDCSMLMLLGLTSQRFSPLSIVYRSQAKEAGIDGIADAFDLDSMKLIRWIAEYSEFPYTDDDNPWLKYGFPGAPDIPLN